MTINDIKKTFKLNDKGEISYFNKKTQKHILNFQFDLTITKISYV